MLFRFDVHCGVLPINVHSSTQFYNNKRRNFVKRNNESTTERLFNRVSKLQFTKAVQNFELAQAGKIELIQLKTIIDKIRV